TLPASFRARMPPGASRYRAEQERGSGLTPGPHSVRSAHGAHYAVTLRSTCRTVLRACLHHGPATFRDLRATDRHRGSSWGRAWRQAGWRARRTAPGLPAGGGVRKAGGRGLSPGPRRAWPGRLGADLHPAGRLLGLREADRQDPLLHGGLDLVGVDVPGQDRAVIEPPVPPVHQVLALLFADRA